MEKILFFTSNYYPVAGANGICSDEIMQELIARGFEVHLICYGDYNLQKEEIINGVFVYRIGMTLFHDLNVFSSNIQNFRLSEILRSIAFFMKRTKLLIYLPIYPVTSLYTIYKFYRQALKLHKRNDFKIVISSFNPIEGLISGHLLKKKFNNIKYVMYVLDSLSNTGSGKYLNSNLLQKIGWNWEKRFYSIADKILLMKSHENFHKMNRYDKFRNKMEFVDIPLLTNRFNTKLNNQEASKSIKIIYTGGLDSNRRNPQSALEIFGKLIKQNIQLDFYSRGDCESLIKEFEKKTSGKIARRGLISHEDSLVKIRESNFLLSIGNSNSDMIPSKIFEYMASGKPIIHFYKFEGDSSNPYLKKYPLALLINENDDEKTNLMKIDKFMKANWNNRVEYDAIKEIFKRNTPEYTVDKILSN
ncbi:hypothetical protein EF384_04350 [Aerococcus agrisoli]|uniref:Glycosyltransferase family 1 protein n=1 Tax=Aerococcus agrisoli TaxID=2487350 RepID=A0A3N4GD23_9LACT|nr:hypothetical protein [Aerococcus agrisoli]RPA60682.1 hypothetical protein EF384_04350 [Aerococcus agrisoli]